MSPDLYTSSNGDRWLLLRDLSDGRSFVRHEANLASGRHVTNIALAAFSLPTAVVANIRRYGS